MDRLVVKSRIARDGVLHLDVALGQANADREVQVTLDLISPASMTREEWRNAIEVTAGSVTDPTFLHDERGVRSNWNEERFEANKWWILHHLREALEELTRTISELESKKDYLESEFYVAMAHLYHHLNSAWNTRCEDPLELAAISQDNFNKWRGFPSDICMD